MTPVRPASSAAPTYEAPVGAAAPRPGAQTELLPEPLTPSAYDDVLTALAVMTVRQRHDQRTAGEEESKAASKVEEEAQARKIAEMHELANDTFTQGLVEGVLEGAGAVAAGGAALTQYSADMSSATKDAKVLVRDASLLNAASKGFGASSRLAGSLVHRDQELDREAMAVADADIERAKTNADAGSAESRRATEDIRDLLGAVRQYVAAKTQLANASALRA
jgi:hypothetical protein